MICAPGGGYWKDVIRPAAYPKKFRDDVVAVAAVGKANVAGCRVHSDRGLQFRSRRFVETIRANGLAGSMGRVGAASDDAAMESFFALL